MNEKGDRKTYCKRVEGLEKVKLSNREADPDLTDKVNHFIEMGTN